MIFEGVAMSLKSGPILRKCLILIGKSKNSSAKKLTGPKVKKRRENLLILILID